MRNVMTLALTLAFTSSAAFASDHLNQIATHARELATDYSKMSATLKDKKFPVQELKDEVAEADAALAKLKQLVADYQATNPNLNAAQQKEWKKMQDLVALLTIFQDRKAELVSGENAQKKRKSVQAEAEALVTRAKLLEQAARQMAGGSAPQS